MPDMDGLSLQRMLAQTAVGLPVIMITGHADISMAVQAMRNGAFDFIEKPVDDELLVASITSAIEQRKQTAGSGPDEKSLMARFGLLTDREKSVAEMVAEGYSSAAIASTFLNQRTHRGPSSRQRSGQDAGNVITPAYQVPTPDIASQTLNLLDRTPIGQNNCALHQFIQGDFRLICARKQADAVLAIPSQSVWPTPIEQLSFPWQRCRDRLEPDAQ